MRVFWILAAFLALVTNFKVAESAITGWTKPEIDGAEGSETLVEKINDGVTSGDPTNITIAATSNGTDTTYTIVSQDPASPDLDIDDDGIITVASGTIDYSAVTSFTLVISANDNNGTASTATVTLSVNAVPTFSSFSSSPCIEDGASAGTELITLSATDENTEDNITYAIASGDTNSDFTITNEGVVEVNTAKTLNESTTSSYTLVITATDDSSTPLIATATVTATVSATCSGAALLAVSSLTILAALIVSLL